MDRRHFLSMLGLGAVGLTLPGVAQADILKQAAANPNIKPISGSWFEFQHPGGKEGVIIGERLKIVYCCPVERKNSVKSVRPVWNIW